MCSKLPATFAFFPVLSRGYTHAQLNTFYLLSTFTAFHMTKIPGSPRLHNFNVRVPERGSLGTRLLGGIRRWEQKLARLCVRISGRDTASQVTCVRTSSSPTVCKNKW